MDSNKLDHLSWYNKTEEQLNIYTHAIGFLLATMALFLLSIKAKDYAWIPAAGFIIFGISQVALFSASTLYHAQTIPSKRKIYNIVDHAMIYVSIAGTYSPICLIPLKDNGGHLLFFFVWFCALLGMILKIRFTGRYNLLSTLMYLGMGWVLIFYWPEINTNMHPEGVNLIIWGGISYTIGAILYMVDKIPYNHALFHLFILFGAGSHFAAIYGYM